MKSMGLIALSSEYPIHVAYQCPDCTWGSITAVPQEMTNEQILAWFSCPVHGDNPEHPERETQIRKMDLRKLKKS